MYETIFMELLGFLGTLPLVLHLKQSAIIFIPLRYVGIHSLHMLCDSFKSSSPGRSHYLGSENWSLQVKTRTPPTMHPAFLDFSTQFCLFYSACHWFTSLITACEGRQELLHWCIPLANRVTFTSEVKRRVVLIILVFYTVVIIPYMCTCGFFPASQELRWYTIYSDNTPWI